MSDMLNRIDLRFDYVAEKLADHTITDRGCWEYNGPKNEEGYGRVLLCVAKLSPRKRYYRAHRLSYAFYQGADPGAMMVCHKCDNPSCINPDHLFLGTAADNSADMAAKKRASPQAGILNSARKLDEPLVLDIVSKIKQGLSNTAIARDLPITHHQVSLIRLGKSWHGLLQSIGYNPAEHRLKTQTR